MILSLNNRPTEKYLVACVREMEFHPLKKWNSTPYGDDDEVAFKVRIKVSNKEKKLDKIKTLVRIINCDSNSCFDWSSEQFKLSFSPLEVELHLLKKWKSTSGGQA